MSGASRAPVEAVRWVGDATTGAVHLVEQTLLPTEETDLVVCDVAGMVDAIRRLAVRGAPAIGVAAAYGLVLGLREPEAELARAVESAVERLAASRPTAVNLFWALDRCGTRARRELADGADRARLAEALLDEARAIHDEDRDTCARMGAHGAELLPDGAVVLTHCNTGALATGGMGTALAPVYTAAAAGRRVRVYADETRPLLQGARLTAWELDRAGIDVTLLVDGAAGSLLRTGEVDVVLVGSDRIARNGDVCNKIGTYPLAVLAREHGVPFWVVAPLSTFDPDTASGDAIPIEQRDADEVRRFAGCAASLPDVRVHNPAFDVTPAELVTGIVTEHGRLEAPDTASVEELLRHAGRI